MFLNYLFGFIIPWILGIYLIINDRKTLFIISPFMSAMAFGVNTWGFHYHYWSMKPYGYSSYSSLPFNVGLYPVYASYLVHFIHKGKLSPILLVIITSTLTFSEEFCAFFIGQIIYSNGWNIFLTFISYLIPYFLCYCYYLELKQLKVYS